MNRKTLAKFGYSKSETDYLLSFRGHRLLSQIETEHNNTFQVKIKKIIAKLTARIRFRWSEI